MEHIEEDLQNERDFDDFSISQKLESNTLAYICGYICHRIKSKFKCIDCESYIMENEDDKLDKSLILIRKRRYNEDCNLSIPSFSFKKLFIGIFKLFDSYFEKNACQKHVLKQFIEIINKKNRWQFPCITHSSKILKYIVLCFLRFQIKQVNKKKLLKKEPAKLN